MKTKSGLLISLLLVFFFKQSVFAQLDSTNRKGFKHALGVAAGGTTGYGLSYRYHPNKFGVQTTFAPFKSDQSVRYCIGLTFLFKLIEAEKTSLFLYQGNQYLYQKEKYSYGYTYNSNGKVNNYFSHGIGVGIEFLILKRISFNLMGGYAAYRNFDQIGFTGETGLYFKF